MGMDIRTFDDYMNDETCVSSELKEKINFEVEHIGKMIEAQEMVILSIDSRK